MRHLIFRPRGVVAAGVFVALLVITGLFVSVGSGSTVSAKRADNKPAPQLERAMLALVNEERGKRGLRLLSADGELTRLARAHSLDMILRRYFSHYSPEGDDPFDRFRSAGINYRAAGENLALAPELEQAHNMLMKSKDHRENILRPSFGHVGIGIIDGGSQGLMISQEFRD
jgi:uncharacterized protein YkwD